MTTQTQQEKMKERVAEVGPFVAVFGPRKSTMTLSLAVLGCLVVGIVGIAKAIQMTSLFGVLACLVVSVATFGLVIYSVVIIPGGGQAPVAVAQLETLGCSTHIL